MADVFDVVKKSEGLDYSAKVHLQEHIVQQEATATVGQTSMSTDGARKDPVMAPAEIITYEKLVAAIEQTGRSYNMDLIERAYQLADDAHQGIKRRSGEPYVCHPLAVARLLLDLGMDSESIAGALLHDVVEDTAITLDEIKSKFGDDVALLVDGVTKLTKIQVSNTEAQQAENLRKMLLAMSQDVRVMIIKLCDRLHNMRTGDAWPPQKRRDKARETMEVYAPIANRLGILNIKEELEDRSLHYLDDVAYNEIQTLLSEHAGEAFLVNVSQRVKERLEEDGIHDPSMKRRVKSIYGIYRKTYIKNSAFDEVYDVYAVRIVLRDVAECYHALGLIHDMYRPLPNRFKDYISTPKPNGYQSLHTTVVGKDAIPFEVQIRTKEMDEMAEYGVAAHWKYKEGVKGKDKLEERLAWVRQLLENQQVSDDADDILGDLKGDLLPEEVFAFTPKGAVINLPAGAICIDFAYAIHSAVGNRMIGCKVNNRIVPIDHQVATGEIIEVIMGPADKGPSRNWLKIVRTSEARNKIRTWFKKMCKEENIEQGRDVLTKEMRREMITLDDEEWAGFMANIARRMRQNSEEDLYAAIGYGGLTVASCMPKIKEDYTKLRASAEPKQVQLKAKPPRATDGVIVEGIDNCLVKFAKCCSPLPGDDIIGFVTRGFGVSIHKRNCINVASSLKDPTNADRWVHSYWEENIKESYKATVIIDALDRDGLVSDVAINLGDMRVPIYAINGRPTESGVAQLSITIGINNTEHLNNVVTRLRKIKDVFKITRS